jgi:hypothetical protein
MLAAIYAIPIKFLMLVKISASAKRASIKLSIKIKINIAPNARINFVLYAYRQINALFARMN